MEMRKYNEIDIVHWAVEYVLNILEEQMYIFLRARIDNKQAFFVYEIRIRH
jgi:hypothetical protein